MEIDDDAALTGDTGYTACDTLEGTVGDADEIVGNETTLGQLDLHDVLVADRRDTHQGLHVARADGERRVLAVGVGLEVIVIIGDEVRLVGVVDVVVGLGRGDVGKEKVHEGHEDAPTLAILDLIAPHHSQIGIGVLGDEEVENLLGVAIEDTENVPALRWVGSIADRPPCF